MGYKIHLAVLCILCVLLFCICPPLGIAIKCVIKEVRQRQWEDYVSGKHKK